MYDLDSLLQQFLQLVSEEGLVKQPTQPAAPVRETTKLPSNRTYQNPIKGTYYCSGLFGHGDARHKGIHNGVDLRAPGGTSVYSIANGVVHSVSSEPKGGNVIAINHGNNLKSIYRHMGMIYVRPGQEVDKEIVIGTVGDTGNAKNTPPHVHFEIKENGQYVDPKKYIYVPPYTGLQPGERSWLSTEHKQNARNFKVNEHLSRQASYIDEIEKIANLYYYFNL